MKRKSISGETNRGLASGMTLIETVVATSIFLVLIVGVTALARSIFSLNAANQGNLIAQNEVRSALKTMEPELRSLAPSSTGAYPLETISTSTLTFYADTNNDGIKDRIRYFISGGTLRKGVIVPSGNPLAYAVGNETVTDIVHNLVATTTAMFDYYDTNYDGTTAALAQPVLPSTVRLVKITIPITRSNRGLLLPVIFTTQVSLRNLKDNL